jgi:hypothetical protein
MRHAKIVAAALAGLAALSVVAQDVGGPNVFDRVEKKMRDNPGLRALTEGPPAPLALAKFMLGTWSVTERRYATHSAPEKIRKGTADVKLELGNRWIVSRIKMEDGSESVAWLGFDPWKQFWYWQFFSSEGRGTNNPLISIQSWDGGRLSLSGLFYLWGEPAKTTLRIVKWDDTLWGEVFEEKVSEQDVQPLIEIRYTRKKGSDAKAPAAPPKAPSPPKSN